MKRIRITESQYNTLINEVRYISNLYDKRRSIHDGHGGSKVTPTANDTEPIKKNDKIRVFHGTDMSTAYQIALEGVSGNEIVSRSYSYEAGMNPAGLFVTTDFYQAKEFGFAYDNVVILEFTANADDMDTPVWNKSSTYFVQGSNPQPFTNRGERTIQWIQYRKSARDGGDERVEKSFNPALAQTLFHNYEHQALFYGDLNPNMIKRFWVKDMGYKSDRGINYQTDFVPYSRKEFIRLFGERYKHVQTKKLYKPNEELGSSEELARRIFASTRGKRGIPITDEDVTKLANDIQDKVYNQNFAFSQDIKTLLFPKQLMDLYNPDGYRDTYNSFYPQNYSKKK